MKALIGIISKWTLGRVYQQPDSLLVLNYHGTQKKYLKNFRTQIKALSKRFKFIAPEELDAFYQGEKKDGPYLLLTFDDGIQNNIYALEVLKEFGVKALFFIVPNYVDASDSVTFFKHNIRPVINSSIDGAKEDLESMSWDTIRTVVDAGHSIGSHSLDHLMSEKDNVDMVECQVVESKKVLVEKIGSKVDAFCAPNDSLRSLNKISYQRINQIYDKFYSTFPGVNRPNDSPHLIKRSNVEAYWPINAMYFAISNFEFKRYRERISKLEEMKLANGTN